MVARDRRCPNARSVMHRAAQNANPSMLSRRIAEAFIFRLLVAGYPQEQGCVVWQDLDLGSAGRLLYGWTRSGSLSAWEGEDSGHKSPRMSGDSRIAKRALFHGACMRDQPGSWKPFEIGEEVVRMTPLTANASVVLRCPGCGSGHINRSRIRRLLDYLLLLLSFRPYRCICDHRFYASKFFPSLRPPA